MEQSRLIPFYRKMARKNAPAKARIELTRRCNLKCVHCKVVCDVHATDELTPEDIHNILPQLRDMGTFEVNLTGGEIFARPDIMPVLEAIFEYDFIFTFQTNGTLMRDEHFEFVEKNKNRISRFGVSVYAGTPEIHEKITGVKGSFDKTIAAIRHLRETGVPVAAFTMLMSHNAPYHEQTKKFFEDNGIVFQFGALMITREDGCAAPLELRVDTDMMPDLPIQWEEYLNPDPACVPDSYPPETSISEWCIAGRFANIMPNADVVPCSVIRTPVGNLRRRTFEEIWTTSPLLDELRSITVGDLDCRDCEYFPRCKPCVGIAMEEQGRFTARPREYCRMTKKYLEK